MASIRNFRSRNLICFASRTQTSLDPTLSRKFCEQPVVTNLRRQRKSQTVSGQSRKVLFAAWPVLRKVGTLSPFFKALPPALILSTPSIEFLKSKIQTASGEFIATRVAVARGESLDILRPAHPPRLWLCQAQMWRVFLSPVLARGGEL
jgi:hypothetical protein